MEEFIKKFGILSNTGKNIEFKNVVFPVSFSLVWTFDFVIFENVKTNHNVSLNRTKIQNLSIINSHFKDGFDLYEANIRKCTVQDSEFVGYLSFAFGTIGDVSVNKTKIDGEIVLIEQ